MDTVAECSGESELKMNADDQQPVYLQTGLA